MNLYSLVADAIEELRAWYRDHPDEREAYDAIVKIVESAVPTNTDDLLNLVAENPYLAVDTPEFRPVLDGSPTPVIIAANICEIVEAALWTAWHGLLYGEEAEDDAASGDDRPCQALLLAGTERACEESGCDDSTDCP